MSLSSQSTSFYVGWDVGGGNGGKNGKSRDAMLTSTRRE